MDIFELLRLTVEKGTSDLHLTPKSPPLLHTHGELFPVKGGKMSSEETALDKYKREIQGDTIEDKY